MVNNNLNLDLIINEQIMCVQTIFDIGGNFGIAYMLSTIKKKIKLDDINLKILNKLKNFISIN